MLDQYEPLVKFGKVLDLGIGEGRNTLKFALKSYDITGVDISKTALDRCDEIFKNTKSDYELLECDLSEYDIKEDTYSLIISSWSLNFIKKSDALRVISDSLKALKIDGLLYIGVFSKEDSQMNEYKLKYQEIERDTFYIKDRDMIKCYFDMKDITDLLEDNHQIICKKEDLSLDFGHGDEHYHGAIELMIRRS